MLGGEGGEGADGGRATEAICRIQKEGAYCPDILITIQFKPPTPILMVTLLFMPKSSIKVGGRPNKVELEEVFS